jgi:transcription initiation factor TFIID TATA-box-binding protein
VPVPVDSVTIQNVVASTSIDQEIDLEALATDLDGVSYDPEQFPGLVYELRKPQATSLLFRSGTLVCTGADSRDACEQAVERTFQTLGEVGLKVPTAPDVIVQNIVSTGDLGQSLNLNAIAIGLGLEHTEYEPSMFPGLIYRMEDPDVVVLLFGSGKVVITGGTHPSDATAAVDHVHNELVDLELLAV